VASGSPVPRRRAFAEGIPALRSLRAACAFALRALLAGKTGSRGTGDPSLTVRYGVLALYWLCAPSPRIRLAAEA